jgi:hypothetical protein
MRHEVGYTLEKFRVEATIPNRKKGETIVTPEKLQMGLTSLVLVSIWIVAYPRKACEKALPTTPDSN